MNGCKISSLYILLFAARKVGATTLNKPTSSATAFGNNRFDGYSPEVIIYGRYLTPAERRKVESYLAVKYGITLNNSYLDSEGNLIWDKDENQGYHHRVTAIGWDAASALHQPLSTTSYEEGPSMPP